MKTTLNENFDIRKGNFTTKNGSVMPIIYIDATNGDSTYAYKKTLENEYGAKLFSNKGKYWLMWWIPKNNDEYEQLINNKIIPCQKFLLSKENGIDKDNGEKRNVIDIIDKLINILHNEDIKEVFPPVGNINPETPQKMASKIEALKRELLNAVSSEEFKKKLEPIINFRNAQGAGYSFLNSILIYIQKPNARLVKSKSNWFAANRGVSTDAKPIVMWVPIGTKMLTLQQQNKIKQDYLTSIEKTEDQLTIGEKEKLKKMLNTTNTRGFVLSPSFYDYEDTYLLPGKKDLVGDISTPKDLDWYDKENYTDKRTISLCDAAIKFAENDRHLIVNYVGSDKLGSARGVSTSNNEIRLLQGENKGVGMFNTICHETAHELLHFRYKNSNDNALSDFFIGTSQGLQIVEQQAELTAWIVVRTFGYNSDTSFNYAGIWGMDEKNAVKVFDTVAGAANALIKGIEKYSNEINESIHLLNEITGSQVAALCGCEDVYKRSKENEDTINNKISEIKRTFKHYL